MERVHPGKLNTGSRTGVVRPELLESIKQDGLLIPILVDIDYTVIDGADRLAACVQLGHDRVNVTVAETSDQAIESLFLAHKGRVAAPRRAAEIYSAMMPILIRRRSLRAAAAGAGKSLPKQKWNHSRTGVVRALNLSAEMVLQNAMELFRPGPDEEPPGRRAIREKAALAVDAGELTTYQAMRLVRRWHLDQEFPPTTQEQRQLLSSTCVAIHGSTRALASLPTHLSELPEAELVEWLAMLTKSRRAIQTTIEKIRRAKEASK
jgi:ParB-like chromosome segregation protein Spo0J